MITRPKINPQSVLVTGGAGYIGSHAVLALQEAGYSPIVLDDLSTGVRQAIPTTVPFYAGDFGDLERVRSIFTEHCIGSVMHFAGSIIVPESVENPLKYYRNNTVNSISFIGACVESGVERFIFSSTAAVYGDPATVPVREDAPTKPLNPYGSSKLMTEMVLRDVAAAHPSFKPVCLRYFNVAGADPLGRSGQQGPQSTHLIRMAIEVALGQRPVLDIFGTDYETRDGTCERDYIHVSDLAAAHVAVLRYLEAGGEAVTLNCGYGRGYTVSEVVHCLDELLGRTLPTRGAPRRPGDSPRLVSDISELRRRLWWTPNHDDLSDIIASALRWQDSRARSSPPDGGG